MSNDTLRAKLYEVQKSISVPKGRYNKFAGFNYRSCEDILEGIKRILPPYCAVTISDEVKIIGDRYYVEATATFWYQDINISVKACAREPLEKKGYDAAQITGATSSYARKYALNGLFAIDDSEDADTANNSPEIPQYTKKENEKPRVKEYPKIQEGISSSIISKKEYDEMSNLIKETGTEIKTFKSVYGVDDLTKMHPDKYKEAMGMLNKKLKRQIESVARDTNPMAAP